MDMQDRDPGPLAPLGSQQDAWLLPSRLDSKGVGDPECLLFREKRWKEKRLKDAGSEVSWMKQSS